MENQHRLIKGYRELSQEDINMMNLVKDQMNALGATIKKLESMDHIDQRWVAIAKTDIQKGGMSLVRSIAQPQTFA